MSPALREWLKGLLAEDNMVDSFAQLHPHAEERFTCWDQYRNKRHENIGSRIDYIIVERNFFDRHARQGAPLAGGGRALPGSAAAALVAATLGGLSQPSPFAGGGMPALEEDEYIAQFRPEPSTGIIYTPPQLSDHVAVSLLLYGCQTGSSDNLVKDAATQRAQPHKAAKRITDFFGKKAAPAAVGQPPAKRRTLGAA